MFAGIIAGTGKIVAMKDIAAGKQLIIQLNRLGDGLVPGASVAVNGVCVTVERLKKSRAHFSVIPETLGKTNLGKLEVGNLVNIERSLKLGDTIDGHFVQGHVDGVGKVTKNIADHGEFKLWIRVPAKLIPYIAPRGSVAVNGVSLTVADVKKDVFVVALIPLTLELTNLGRLEVGDTVNIETDILARQIVHYLKTRRS